MNTQNYNNETRRNYFAYGSNLNIDQMMWRCPDAEIVGTANLYGYELLYKGSKSGNYLTIEKAPGGVVPIAVWSVTAEHERALDRYEGCPSFYYKAHGTNIPAVEWYSGEEIVVDGFVYIMHEERLMGIPTDTYVETCRQGYMDFGFDLAYLNDAYDRSAANAGRAKKRGSQKHGGSRKPRTRSGGSKRTASGMGARAAK